MWPFKKKLRLIRGENRPKAVPPPVPKEKEEDKDNKKKINTNPLPGGIKITFNYPTSGDSKTYE